LATAQSGPERSGSTGPPPPHARRGAGWAWLLLIPFFATFFPWIYNTGEPDLFGFPFFYWYQMLWVPVSMLITVVVYRMQKRGGR
jgi:Protein of unknown function (DUF3311)